jgi:hypothetical protein
MSRSFLRLSLLVCTGFLALTACAGGIGLLTGAAAPPVEMLSGSPFPDYTIPALALAGIVGGMALLASVLLIRRHHWAVRAALLSGLAILIFELVEVLAIGSPPGIARNLQVFYFTLGSLICLLAGGLETAKRMGN